MFFLVRKILFFPLIIISFMGINIPKIKAEITPNLCQENKTLAYYELENRWIYICSESEQLFLLDAAKNNLSNIFKVPASGGFPTYAAVEGELSDPNSKLYNISPFYFQIIEASIITKIEPVLRTVEPALDVVITPLSGADKNEALIACQDNQPVQVFETKTAHIYICIDANQDDENAVDLTYVQINKSNPNLQTSLSAELISSFRYQTSTQNQTSYVISYQGLETYQNGVIINTEPVTNVYLIASEPHEDKF